MRYYISADGGGTKLASILFDEQYRLCGVGMGGPVNRNFASEDTVRRSMEDSIAGCLREIRPKELSGVYFAGPGPVELYQEVLEQQTQAPPVLRVDEGAMCVYAGLLADSGIAAVSGTGSCAFYIERGERVGIIGGWGSLFGDDGGGYDIGCAGIRAAIAYYDGLGPETRLLELLYETFGEQDMWKVLPHLYVNDYRQVISGLCRLVARAAQEGDTVAAGIFRDAGIKMAEQVIACRKKWQIPEDRRVVIAGSAWKGLPVMYEVFQERICQDCSAVTVQKPSYVPVVGGVVRQMIKNGTALDEARKEFLQKEYSQFQYR